MTIEPQAITKGLVTESDFQQAKNPTKGSQFLQIVAKPKRSARKKPEPKLTRVAFRVSRLMEFCTRRELQNQTGHGVEQWPLVVLKELVDNALDACEEAEVAPVISIAVEPGSIVVEDNARRHQDQHDQVHPGLHDPGLQPRGLRVADPRRAGQRAQDDPGDGLRARSRAPGRQCRGGGRDDHRDPRHRTPNRIPGRPRQQRTEDCPHHLAIAGQDRIADHDQLAGDTTMAARRSWTTREASS